MRYFSDCANLSDLKKTYRKFCMKLHPDLGGSCEEFNDMNSEYETLLKRFSNTANFENDANGKENEFYDWQNDKFATIIQNIIFFDKMKIEIIGQWIWCFEAFEYKEQLKKLGFWFSGSKKAWVYNGQQKKGRGHFSKNQLHSKFGFETVETIKQNKLK